MISLESPRVSTTSREFPLISCGTERSSLVEFSKHLFPVDWQLDTALRDAYRRTKAYITRHPLMLSEHSTPENSDIQILPPGFKFDPNGAKPPSQKFKVKIGGKQKS